ncbi:hypothetical protein JCM24511_00524 [Saitozyma sp. JCM 24511]|uniref:Uncharacterized protein n=1 Tax=Saitozyma podzolica TaxID=1890683 RepID=A0A427YTI7_9TREE|nr:hypothetical protein EHS25_004247 [Saitozyma podzolica]GFZ42806.1 hypothetical protein JCM24511_00524 [Saitozyma sp. JCM 24511]
MTWPAPASRADAVAESILQHAAPIIYDEPESTSKTQVVEQRKRSYSAGLYTYTKLKWDDFRQDVE